MQGVFILVMGWTWAESATPFFRQPRIAGALGPTSRGAYDEYWGLTIPMAVTGICLAALVSTIVVKCALRRRSELLLVAVLYAWAMANAWLCLYAWLKIQAFP